MPANPFVTFTGPLLVGAVLNGLFLGFLLFQIYLYQKLFPKDPLWIKGVVYSLLFMDVVQSVLSTHYVWDVLVDKWGQGTAEDLVNFPWSIVSIPVIGGLVAMEAQFFFIWRIHRLRPVWWVTYVICPIIGATSLLQGLAALIAVSTFASSLTVESVQLQATTTMIWLAGSFVCDILIALAMIGLLAVVKQSSSWTHTSSLIDTLIYRVVETGAATAVVACVELALFVHFSDNYIHITPAFILCKLYSNAVLANLNARKPVSADKLVPTFRSTESHEFSTRREATRQTTIHVQTNVENDFDDMPSTKVGGRLQV